MPPAQSVGTEYPPSPFDKGILLIPCIPQSCCVDSAAAGLGIEIRSIIRVALPQTVIEDRVENLGACIADALRKGNLYAQLFADLGKSLSQSQQVVTHAFIVEMDALDGWSLE